MNICSETIDFYISPTNHDKVFSVSPCAPWLMKPVPDESFPMMKVSIDEETIEMTVPSHVYISFQLDMILI